MMDSSLWQELAYWALGACSALLAAIVYLVWERISGNTSSVKKFMDEAAVRFERSREETSDDLDSIETKMAEGFNGIGQRLDNLRHELQVDMKEIETAHRHLEGELYKTRSVGIQEHAAFDKRITEHDYRILSVERAVGDLRGQLNVRDHRANAAGDM